MTTKRAGQNLRRVESGLEGPEIAWLNEQMPGLGDKLHRALSNLGSAHAASGGHLGPVMFKKQEGKNADGKKDAALILERDRIAGVDDPFDDLDAVNFQTLRRYLRESEDRKDEELASTLAHLETAVSGVLSEFWGVTISVPTIGTTSSGNANILKVWKFELPVAAKFNTISFQSTGVPADWASVGLYDSNKTLIVSARESILANDIFNTSVGLQELDPGTYWLASTVTGGSLFFTNIQDGYWAIQNDVEIVTGNAGATTNGFLPSSFTTVSAQANHGIVIVRFWLQ